MALNLVHLLASMIEPYMPDTARSINKQLSTEPLLVPDVWNADSIKKGHQIGNSEYLFTRIKPEKAKEWRLMFGGETVKAKDDKVALKSKKAKAGNEKNPPISTPTKALHD